MQISWSNGCWGKGDQEVRPEIRTHEVKDVEARFAVIPSGLSDGSRRHVIRSSDLIVSISLPVSGKH